MHCLYLYRIFLWYNQVYKRRETNMLKRHVYNNLKTINDFKDNRHSKKRVDRKQIKVCFIDDKGYDKETFSSTGYIDVDVKTEYTNSNDFAAYQIIVCDIDGVGTKIDSKKQGLAVAETLKKAFPDKIIMTFSSKNPYAYAEKFNEIADGYFNKMSTPAEIADELDKKAIIYFDEVAAWKHFENELRKDEISNKTIAFMEDLYVESLLEKENLFNEKRVQKDMAMVKDILSILGLAARVVSRFI